jgi:hypothetical protein
VLPYSKSGWFGLTPQEETHKRAKSEPACGKRSRSETVLLTQRPHFSLTPFYPHGGQVELLPYSGRLVGSHLKRTNEAESPRTSMWGRQRGKQSQRPHFQSSPLHMVVCNGSVALFKSRLVGSHPQQGTHKRASQNQRMWGASAPRNQSPNVHVKVLTTRWSAHVVLPNSRTGWLGLTRNLETSESPGGMWGGVACK